MADCSQAVRFVTSLTGSLSEPVTIQTLPERGNRTVPTILHGSLESHWRKLAKLNELGAAVSVMVNAGDGLGRTARNVTRVRALFCDFDGASLPSRFALEPHIITETSPGRFHIYWLVSDVPLGDFAVLQRALADTYGADPAVCDLARAMRLPGSLHQKSTPTLVRLIAAKDHERYTYARVLAAWPELGEALVARQRARAESEARRQRALEHPVVVTSKRVQRLLQSHHDAVAGAPEGQRHSTLLRHAKALGGFVGSGTVTLEAATEALSAAAEVCGLLEAEAAAAIAWGLEQGQAEPLFIEVDVVRRATLTRRDQLRAWYA